MRIYKRKVKEVVFITLKNKVGMKVVLSTFGASFYDLKVPNKENKSESVILTPTNLDDFYYTDAYYGKTVGRFSGRIDKARCIINGFEYVLEKNWNGLNALHGCKDGISFKNFEYEKVNNCYFGSYCHCCRLGGNRL